MNRFCWILVTFLTRPLMWGMMIAIVVGAGYLYNFSTDKYQTATPEILLTNTPVRSTDQLEMVGQAAAEKGIEIDWGSLASEEIMRTAVGAGAYPTRISDQQHQEIGRRLTRLKLPDNVSRFVRTVGELIKN